MSDTIELNMDYFCSSINNHIGQSRSTKTMPKCGFTPSPEKKTVQEEALSFAISDILDFSFSTRSATPTASTFSLRRKSKSLSENDKIPQEPAIPEDDSSSCMSLEETEKIQSQDSKEAKQQFLQMTNIEDIQDFNEYTAYCFTRMSLIDKPKDEDIRDLQVHLDDKYINMINSGKKKLAVFDMDETLVHCDAENYKDCDKVLNVRVNDSIIEFGINFRPFLFECLKKLQREYVMVVYTASSQMYAEKVLSVIDPDNEIFAYRLYRHNCIQINLHYPEQQVYIKDLRVFKDIDLKNIVIIDNSVLSFSFQLDNGIPILPFYFNKNDTELEILVHYLSHLHSVSSIPQENSNVLQLGKLRKDAEDDNNTQCIISFEENGEDMYMSLLSTHTDERKCENTITQENEYDSNTSGDYHSNDYSSSKIISIKEKLNFSFGEYNKQAQRKRTKDSQCKKLTEN